MHSVETATVGLVTPCHQRLSWRGTVYPGAGESPAAAFHLGDWRTRRPIRDGRVMVTCRRCGQVYAVPRGWIDEALSTAAEAGYDRVTIPRRYGLDPAPPR